MFLEQKKIPILGSCLQALGRPFHGYSVSHFICYPMDKSEATAYAMMSSLYYKPG